jgi:Mrp family chromosome partitioning ATPase
MSVFVFASAKGSPGVTTTVLALAATWPTGRRVLVAECDPDGGDVAVWFGLAAEPGLVSCAAEGRRRLRPHAVWEHAQTLPGPGGVRVLVAPAAAEQATAALAALGTAGLDEALAGLEVDVLVDGGRLGPGSPLAPLLSRSAVTVLVARPSVAQVAHLRPRLAALRGVARPVVLLVGDRPYGPAEVAAAVGVPVLGVIAHDEPGAGVLCGRRRGGRAWIRSPMMRSARQIAAQLAASTTQARLPTQDLQDLPVDASMVGRGAG